MLKMAMNLIFRFFFNILKNLIFKRPMEINETSIISMRVLPTDLDLNFHMNNGRYLTIMDIGRTELVIRSGLHKLVIAEKLSAVASGININFFKPLAPLEKYELHTSVLTWDESWFYLKQEFIKDNQIKASAIAKVIFLKKGKRVRPDYLLKKMGKEVSPPKAPEYFQSMLNSEKGMINLVKEFNKKS
jgi:acyl-CoA thioesterase FadM